MRLGFIFFVLLLSGCLGVEKGESLPIVEGTTLSGKSITTKSLEGKTVVLNIWATWCGECIGEIEQLNKLKQKYEADSNVVFIAITDESEEKVNRLMQRIPFHFEHLVDAKTLVLEFQKGVVNYIPKHIVSKNGIITFENTGVKKDIYSLLEAEIEKTM